MSIRSTNKLDDSSNLSTKTTKRSRGRPSNKIPYDNDSNLGITDGPSSENNRALIELIYSDSGIFKSIFELFNKHNINITKIIFNTETVEIIGVIVDEDNSTLKIVDRIIINCKNVCRYYCEKYTAIEIKTKDLVNITSNFDNDIGKIILYIDKYDDRGDHVYIKVYDKNARDYATNKITLITSNKKINIDSIPDISDFDVKLSMESKELKKRISKIYKGAQTFKLEKYGNEPLIYSYCDIRNSYDIPFKCDIYDIVSTLDDNDILSISVDKNYVNSFTSLNIKTKNKIDIYINKNDMIIFNTSVNNRSIQISSYIDIVRN